MAADQPTAGDALTEQPSPNLAGQSLGDFRVLRLLGRGGMGEVYLAEQTSLKRQVAVKVLRPDLANNAAYIRRFETEAKAVAPINHANIVSVIAIGQQGDVRYIAMEYVQGMNLRQYINKKGPLDTQAALSVMRKVASALARAAEEGIVHRDIKPENVLLTKKGDVKVADFGLARQTSREDLNLTQSGTTVGTPMYMSPEQVEGKELDLRSDLYSFGVTCYHMMTGAPPYRGETAMAVAVQHCTGKPTPISVLRPDLPIEMERIVEKLMARMPDDRYQSARELIRDLARIKAKPDKGRGESVVSDDIAADALASTATQSTWKNPLTVILELPTTWPKVVGHVRSRPIWIATALVLAVGAGAFAGWMRRPPNVLVGPHNGRKAAPPDHQSIKSYRDAISQILYARNVLDESQREAGLWAVIKFHPGDENESIDAAQELFEMYLARRNYELVMALAEELISRDAHLQKMMGHLFMGIVLSRQQQPDASNESFLKMFENARQARLTSEQRTWLGRQYLLSLSLNSDLRATGPDKQMLRLFDETILRGAGNR